MVNDYVQSSLTTKIDEAKTRLNPAPAQREKRWGACARQSPGCCCRGQLLQWTEPCARPPSGHDRHSPAQIKGLHKLHGSEKTNTRATPPHSRPRVDSAAPAASSSSAPYLRLTAINPSVVGRAQIHHEDTPRPTRRGLLRVEPAARSPAPALTARAAGRTRSAMLCVTQTTGRVGSGNSRVEPRSNGSGRSHPAAHEDWREVTSTVGSAAVQLRCPQRSQRRLQCLVAWPVRSIFYRR